MLQRISPCDLVVVEGFKREAIPKIEVYRVANGRPPLHPQDPPPEQATLQVGDAPEAGGYALAIDGITGLGGRPALKEPAARAVAIT